MTKTKLLFFLLFFFNFSLVYSATITFTPEDPNQNDLLVSAYYCSPNTENCLTYDETNPLFTDENITYANFYDYNPLDTSVWKRFFFYKQGLRLLPYARFDYGSSNLEQNIHTLKNNYFKVGESISGLSPLTYDDLSTINNKCIIDFDGENITSNLKPFRTYGGKYIDLPSNLEKYYFINTSAKFFLANGSIIKKDIFVGDIAVNLSEIYGGNYLAVEFLPQDLKCDFFEGGGLDSREIQGVFVNNSLANINDYFNNTINFSVSNVRQINILNDTLKVDINYSNGGKNVSVNFSRLKKSGGKNVSVYFLLNKSSWGDLSADDIMDLRADFKTNFPLSNEFDFFVVDKDPIIGYHFDELPDNINVGFDGTIDGVLIESDAVVYSGSKDFVFNYRGSGGNCDEKLVVSGGKNICINFFVDGINGSNKKYIMLILPT